VRANAGAKSGGRSHWLKTVAVATALAVALPAASLALGASAAPAPVFASSVDVARTSGTVSVTTPGGTPSTLTTPRQIPVGSTVNANSGAVQVTAADGTGSTYSGQFKQGSFQVLQSATGGGSTEILLVGKCVDASATMAATSDDPAAGAARRPRHKPTVYRELVISANGQFEVVGSDATAVASGQAQYSLVDQCNGTHIIAQTGQVTAQSRNTGSYTLKPHQSLIQHCQPSGPTAQHCTLLLSSPKSSVFSFGLYLKQGTASAFKVCYRTPKGATLCHTAPLAPLGAGPAAPEGGGLTCVVNDGPGVYPVRWLVAGHQVGTTLQFKATKPVDVFLGRDSCTGYTITP